MRNGRVASLAGVILNVFLNPSEAGRAALV
jgi:hypothetical protein